MDIPGEALKRFPSGSTTRAIARRTFIEGAVWARKEALREAADAVGYEDWALMRLSDEPNDFTDWLRALAEEDN